MLLSAGNLKWGGGGGNSIITHTCISHLLKEERSCNSGSIGVCKVEQCVEEGK